MLKKTVLCLTAACILASARNQPPLQVPPNNIPVEKTPMFISFGFDDNSHSGLRGSVDSTGGVQWVINFTSKMTNPKGTGQKATFDGSPVLCSFYSNSYYMEPYKGDYAQLVKWSHNSAYKKGHEIGNHTHSHLTEGNGPTLAQAGWEAEITKCSGWLTKPAPADSVTTMENDNQGAGVPAKEIIGFRSPFLKYGNGTFQALKKLGFKYDCSIEEGLDPAQDGTNFYWPYTLENESPGHTWMVEEAGTKEPAYFKPEHAGLWELPCYALVAPKDEDCAKYGIPSGFRKKLKAHFTSLGKPGSFDEANGKLTGLDYNLYYFQEFSLSKAEALAVLKNTLDLRMKGNRCPMLLGVHSQYYTELWNKNAPNCPSAKERQSIIEEFAAYAVKTYPDVRIVTMKDVMNWCESPTPLAGSGTEVSPKTVPSAGKISFSANTVSLNSAEPVTAVLFTPAGRKISEQLLSPVQGVCRWNLEKITVPGNYILAVNGFSQSVVIK